MKEAVPIVVAFISLCAASFTGYLSYKAQRKSDATNQQLQKDQQSIQQGAHAAEMYDELSQNQQRWIEMLQARENELQTRLQEVESKLKECRTSCDSCNARLNEAMQIIERLRSQLGYGDMNI